ncbi:hypothetical protein MTP99_010906 [Tenebrio molitor]|nr:hypothetical protein MTP99_010906 [Tenebrio molitor]
MSWALSVNISRNCIKSLEEKLRILPISWISLRDKHKLNPKPRLRNPTWFTQKHRTSVDDNVTFENKEFLKEIVQDQYCKTENEVVKNTADVIWRPGAQRTGAEAADPSLFTREYCGIFKDSGVIPKKTLARFFVSHDAALSPGTLVNALHFQVGNYVDVRGLTIDRGFQGVMKRHGFKGMPASHGVTKTHRRGGNIGGGGEKGRVWPGTKMPGHMGATNSIVYIYDTKLKTRQPAEPVPFPTYFGGGDIPENIFAKEIHEFSEPTIVYNE